MKRLLRSIQSSRRCMLLYEDGCAHGYTYCALGCAVRRGGPPPSSRFWLSEFVFSVLLMPIAMRRRSPAAVGRAHPTSDTVADTSLSLSVVMQQLVALGILPLAWLNRERRGVRLMNAAVFYDFDIYIGILIL